MELEKIEKISIEKFSKRDVEIIDFVIDHLNIKDGKIDMTKLLLTSKGKGYAMRKVFN